MKQENSDRTWRRIHHPKAAKLLIDVQQLKYLRPFLGKESSIGQAAQELNLSNDDMYYRVKHMERLGILETTRKEARTGKAIKYYSVVADGLFVPFSATPAETLEALLLGSDNRHEPELVQGLVAGLWEAVADPESWGFRIFKDDKGSLHSDYAPEEAAGDWDTQAFLMKPENPAVLSAWTTLKLSREDAKDLQRRLQELHEEYLGKSQQNRKLDKPLRSYLLRLALAPVGT